MLKETLSHPQVYQTFQEAGGFFGARLKALKRQNVLADVKSIVDIGCGPGFIARHLPPGVRYTGFDLDQSYIEFARAKFGTDMIQFHCEPFDDAWARKLAPVDLVMMNGVLHHMPDTDVIATAKAAAACLGPHGSLFTLDGAYRNGQSSFRRWMLDNDRGKFVRESDKYADLLKSVFNKVAVSTYEDLSWVPYTYAICIAQKS